MDKKVVPIPPGRTIAEQLKAKGMSRFNLIRQKSSTSLGGG